MAPTVEVTLFNEWYSAVETSVQYIEWAVAILQIPQADISVPELGFAISLLAVCGIMAKQGFDRCIVGGLVPGGGNVTDGVMISKHGRGVPPGYSILWKQISIQVTW